MCSSANHVHLGGVQNCRTYTCALAQVQLSVLEHDPGLLECTIFVTNAYSSVL
jgi:hypothetical protein